MMAKMYFFAAAAAATGRGKKSKTPGFSWSVINVVKLVARASIEANIRKFVVIDPCDNKCAKTQTKGAVINGAAYWFSVFIEFPTNNASWSRGKTVIRNFVHAII